MAENAAPRCRETDRSLRALGSGERTLTDSETFGQRDFRARLQICKDGLAVLDSIVGSYRQAYSGLPRSVWVLSTIMLINRSGTMVLPYLGLYLTAKLTMSEIDFGYLLSFYGCGAIVGAYLGGQLCRTLGSIRTQIVCLLCGGPLLVFLGLLQDFWALALFLPFIALFLEAARPATTSATTELCPKALHTKALALNRMAVNLGMAIGPVIGGSLFHWGFIYLVIINGSFSVMAGLLLWLYFGFRRIAPLQELASPTQSLRGASPWRDKIYLTLLLINTLTGIIFFQVMGTYQIYLRDDFAWTEFELGCLLAINTVVIVLMEMVLVDKLKQRNHLHVIGWGCLAVGVGFGVVAFSGSLPFAILSVMLWTFGEMLTMPLSVAYASRRSTTSSRSAYLAAYSMSFSLCMVAAPLIGTRLYSLDHQLPWMISLAMGVLLLVACYGLAKWEKHEQAADAILSNDAGLTHAAGLTNAAGLSNAAGLVDDAMLTTGGQAALPVAMASDRRPPLISKQVIASDQKTASIRD